MPYSSLRIPLAVIEAGRTAEFTEGVLSQGHDATNPYTETPTAALAWWQGRVSQQGDTTDFDHLLDQFQTACAQQDEANMLAGRNNLIASYLNQSPKSNGALPCEDSGYTCGQAATMQTFNRLMGCWQAWCPRHAPKKLSTSDYDALLAEVLNAAHAVGTAYELGTGILEAEEREETAIRSFTLRV
jgi:hypothetical protein